MNKKNFLTTSLASVAVLGAVFFASQTSVVKAAETVDAPTEFVGGVNGAEPAINDIRPYGEAPKDAPVNNVSDFKGGVNGTEPAVLDKPEYPLNKKDSAKPADKPADKPAAKEEGLKVLPKTGTTENAALASVGFLGLVLGALPFAKRKN